MAQVIWSPTARRELRDIQRFIERDSAHYAALTVRRIREAAAILGRFPEMGHAPPDLPEREYRQIIVRPYRVIYRYDRERNVVRVLSVVHGRRLIRGIDDSA